MKCPVCTNVTLVMSERQGIEIDYCPQCRGVWLDRGELDKIIERSRTDAPSQPAANQYAPQPAPAPQPTHHHAGGRHDQDSRRHHDAQRDHYERKRKKSLWEDLFD